MLSKKGIVICVVVVIAAVIGGYMFLMSQMAGQRQGGGALPVKAMNVIKRDTPVTLEYPGTVIGKDTTKVTSKVSGTIVEKYIKGGDQVQAGQALYRIDPRTYQAALLNAQANLAQAQANLNNAKVDLARDEQLYAAEAISEQVLTSQRAQVNSLAANVSAMEALVQTAQQNLDDTVVYAPMSGKLSVDDVAVGTYAAAGTTSLVTIGTSNPMMVQFSVSEAEYLKYVGESVVPGQALPSKNVRIVLSDGKEYPGLGNVVAVDRAMEGKTSSLMLKAEFDNSKGILIPGMFARARLVGDTIKGAILVPQRAVQQLLGKSFVMVVGEGNKSAVVPVELGESVGSYYVIKSGLNGSEQVVVEGLTNLTEGVEMAVTTVSADEMGFSFIEKHD
ncbi:efflux RND transporter periplasmic adaptor subunit [Anaerovibrio sp. JC8]|uniref:efflux RND transporter periplasmic adaptor subunit n=1 Tax=Anaerovibrio sp. JC8 TaxID=1240085 RepID=UPI001E423235|nr:efflux RND transporter periplasmic adaptor subunit [Anaerovibrio sp. JC8]